jgi:hypothetical protein
LLPIPKTSILPVPWHCCRRRRWTRELVKTSSVLRRHRSLVRQQSRVLCPYLWHLGILCKNQLTSVHCSSRLTLKTSWLRFRITIRLTVYAFIVVKSGFLVTGAPRCLRCMLSRRSGLCARMPLKNLKLQIKMYLLIKLPQSRRS